MLHVASVGACLPYWGTACERPASHRKSPCAIASDAVRITSVGVASGSFGVAPATSADKLRESASTCCGGRRRVGCQASGRAG